MKVRKRKKTAKTSLDLIEEKRATGRIITFPGVRGRTIERVRLFTSTDDHAISISFEDKVVLDLSFEPGLVVSAKLADMKTGDFHTIKEWPPILSAPRNPE